MEATGFGLAIIAETRTLLFNIKSRIDNYRKGPDTLRALKENVDCLADHIAQVEKILIKCPSAIPVEISAVFDKHFSRVRDILVDSNRTVEQSLSKVFAQSSSSTMFKLRSKAIRTFRATSLNSKMNTVEAQIKEASNQLFQLTLALGNALKIQEQFEAARDVYQPKCNTPAFTEAVNLDFDGKDESGRPTTPEGILKQTLLSSESSGTVTAAAGVMKPTHGLVGMAGVGKTIALKGLAHDKDVRNRFPDGVLYMSLGQGATVQTALRELGIIVTITGGKAIAETLRGSSSLREAVEYAVPWFAGKLCLFLVDDVWPLENCKNRFLMDLRQLLRESPESRMAISTRNMAIAQCGGSVVRFGARDPLGPVSQKIFMAHATGGVVREAAAHDEIKIRKSVSKILSLCGGLPIALSVTGAAVAFLTNAGGNFESACDTYSVQLEKRRTCLGDEDTMEGRSLNAGILLSLEYLEAEFLSLKTKTSLRIDHSISDLLYQSMCPGKSSMGFCASSESAMET